MLRLRSLEYRIIYTVCQRNYISNGFKEVLETKLPNVEHTHKSAEINEIKSWLLGPHITSQLVVRNYLQEQKENQLLDLLRNRLETRICLNNYSGCYLLNHLLVKDDLIQAFNVAVDFYEEFTNELTAILALKAIYGRLKDDAFMSTLIAPPPPKEKSDKKQRVGFLRNTPVIVNLNEKSEIGKALLSTAHCIQENRLKTNMLFLGYVLCGEEEDAIKIFEAKTDKFFVDILKCAATLTSVEPLMTTLQPFIDSELNQSTDISDAHFEKAIQEAITRTEGPLAENEVLNYSKWVEEHKQKKAADERAKEDKTSIERSQKLLKDLEAQKQFLWYFDNEENVELQISNQQKVYPRKWFGKKKKPRMVDDNYIPPEVIRRS